MIQRPRHYKIVDPVSGEILTGVTIDHNGFRIVGGIVTGYGTSSISGGGFTDSPTTPRHIQVKHGLAADVPTLRIGEPGFAEDTGAFYIGGVSGNVLISTGGSATPSGAAGGDLGGTYPNPKVIALTTGATSLVTGTITDGQFLKRVGATLVSATPTAARIVTSNYVTGQTAGATLFTQATQASDSVHFVGGSIEVTAIGVGTSLVFNVAWTDPSSTAQSTSLNVGTITAIGMYPIPSVVIRTLASSNVVVSVGGTIITVTYNAFGILELVT